MTRPLESNPGDRPSHLRLDRYATGELDGAERAAVETWLADHPEGRKYLDDLEAARARVRPLDLASLRRRASQIVEPGDVPQPANRPAAWTRWLATLMVAALALFFVIPGEPVDPNDPSVIRIKGDAALTAYQVVGTSKRPYAGRKLGEGDAIELQVRGDADDLVVLSVDGTGAISVFYPESGAGTEPMPEGFGDRPLPGSIILDGAPGPEVFVVMFDTDAAAARETLEAEWQSGGADGLVDWARGRDDADALVVERR